MSSGNLQPVYAPVSARDPNDWRSSPHLLDHSDQPVPTTSDFFVPPPVEIGDVRTARSTLDVNKHPKPAGARWATALGVAATIELLVCVPFYIGDSRPPTVFAPLSLGVVPALLGLLVTLYLTRFSHHCSYVGTLGLARFYVSGDRGRVSKAEIFPFAEATELRTRQVRQFVNGVYTGTNYTSAWTNADGRKRFTLNGRHRGKNGNPKPTDPYWFAVAAEVAWSTYLLDQAEIALREQGFLQFNLNRDRFVRVGPGFFEFFLKGETSRVEKDDIKSVTLAQGHFSIIGKDAKRFSSKSKYGFDYSNMANARLFMIAMKKLVGFSFS